jgi:hypothetical protein
MPRRKSRLGFSFDILRNASWVTSGKPSFRDFNMTKYPNLSAPFPILKLSIATEFDKELAAALGHFSQACCHIEHHLEEAISHLLPMTMSMGRVVLSGTAARAKINILRSIAQLPEVPIRNDQRKFINDLCIRLGRILEDRNRILHNQLIAAPDGGYILIQHKRDEDGDASAAMPVTLDEIKLCGESAANALCELFAIPVIKYDTASWGRGAQKYQLKSFSKEKAPSARPKKDKM